MAIVVDQLIARVGIDDSQIPRQLGGVKREIGEGLEQAAKRGAAGVDQAGAALLRQETAALRDAQALARYQAATGNSVQAANTLRTALDNATAVQYRHGLQVETQIARYEQAAQATGGWRGALEQLGGAVTLAGAALVAQQVAQFVGEASQLDQTLDRSENTLQALAGTSRGYSEALATAREQQRLFGGSLSENIEGLSGLVIVSRQSGAELSRLVDISQRLAVLSPEQGAAGARIALSEAFSGDITSLAKRFEIPRAALRELTDESLDAGEKLELLEQYLERVGITAETTAGSVPAITKELNALAQSWEEFQRRIGDAINSNEGVQDFLNGLTQVISFYSAAITPTRELARNYEGMSEAQKVATVAMVNMRGEYELFRNALRDGGREGRGAQEQIAESAALATEKSAKLEQQLARTAERGAAAQQRLADAETRYQEDSASRAQAHTDRLSAITQRAAQQQAETQQQANDRVIAIEAQARSRFEETRSQGLERLADLERRQQQQSEDDQRQHTDRMGDLARRLAETQADAARDAAERQREYARSLEDLQRDAAERAADVAERRGDAAVDRDERRAERRAELEAQLSQATTDEARARAEAALAALEEENAAEDARIARQQAREDERAARDEARRREELERRRQEQEQEAAEALARREAAIAAEQAQQEAAYTEARGRRQAEQEAARTELITDLNGQLEEIKKRYLAEQNEVRTAATARIAQIREAAVQQAAAEAEGYATQEAQRRAAYQRQTEDLKRALGEQIAAAITAQEALGQVSADTARRVLDETQRVYGFTPGEEAAGFRALLSGVTQGGGVQEQVARDYGVAIAGVGNGRGQTAIGSVTIQISGAGDPRQVALAVRDELLKLQSQGVSLGFAS